MEKLVYLLGKEPNGPAAPVGDALLRAAPAIKRLGAYRIDVHIADLTEAVAAKAPARIMGPWDRFGGSIAFWLDNLDDRLKIEPVLKNIDPTPTGYLVTESVVQRYERNWADGEKRPGVTQFSALGKPASSTDDEFYYWWQIRHSQSSFRLHPRRWSYVRNAVARALTPTAANYRAIVLEHFRALDDFTDDGRYFGGEAALAEMNEETPHFCDFNNILGGPTSEISFA